MSGSRYEMYLQISVLMDLLFQHTHEKTCPIEICKWMKVKGKNESFVVGPEYMKQPIAGLCLKWIQIP